MYRKLCVYHRHTDSHYETISNTGYPLKQFYQNARLARVAAFTGNKCEAFGPCTQ